MRAAGVGAGRIGAVRGAQRVAALGGFRAVATVAAVAAAMVMPVGSQDNDDPYADNGGVDIRGMERASECLLPVAWRSTPCVAAINKFERDLLLECGDCMFQSRRALQGYVQSSTATDEPSARLVSWYRLPQGDGRRSSCGLRLGCDPPAIGRPGARVLGAAAGSGRAGWPTKSGDATPASKNSAKSVC